MSCLIVASRYLPLHYKRNSSCPFQFEFSLDEDFLQLSSPNNSRTIFVGTLPPVVRDTVPFSTELSDHLLTEFSCRAVSIPSDIREHYDSFCNRYLGPRLKSVLPGSDTNSIGALPFDGSIYDSFSSAIECFANPIIEMVQCDKDFIWVHDYHLMPLAACLRRTLPHVNVGFYLHCQFPTSEIFCAMSVRDQLLCDLLNFDMLGFQTYDNARHFLSSITRVLGVAHQLERGCFCIDYHGRKIAVKILRIGVNMKELKKIRNSPETTSKFVELQKTYQDRITMICVDGNANMGVGVRFLAFEKLLEKHVKWQGQVVLIEITDAQGLQGETCITRDRINDRFRKPGYEPIILVNIKGMKTQEIAAFLAIADCCIVSNCLNQIPRIPYMYIVYRELTETLNNGYRAKSSIIVPEFVTCTQSLIGTIKVIQWDVESMAKGMISALSMDEIDNQSRHELNYEYIKSHDLVHWANAFDTHLTQVCKNNVGKTYYRPRNGGNFHVVALGEGVETLPQQNLIAGYKSKRACGKLFVFDYERTMAPNGLNRPTDDIIRVLNGLAKDPLSVVIIFSGRTKLELAHWFEPFKRLGIISENGYFFRWIDGQWNTLYGHDDPKRKVYFHWIGAVKSVMQIYTDATNGSYIESKYGALVWHYEDADPEFGLCQAKELMQDLQSVLKKKSAVMKKGHRSVEVESKAINKGATMKRIIKRMEEENKRAEFMLCIGDDEVDEEIFEIIKSDGNYPVFPCTINLKPSRAKYYIDHTEVLSVLESISGDIQAG